MQDSQVTFIFETKLARQKRIKPTLEILPDYTLKDLAEATIRAFEFEGLEDHAFGFFDKERISKAKRRFVCYDVYEPGYLEREIGRLWRRLGDTWYFLYDFGDNWMFIVTLKSVGSTKPGTRYPQILSKAVDVPKHYPEFDE